MTTHAQTGQLKPICFLETLTGDCLAAVLSALYNLEDLWAVIRASPIIYSHFTSAKPHILFAVMTNILGPVMSDAVTLANIDLPLTCDDDYEERVQGAVTEYERRLSLDCCHCATPISVDLAVKVAQLERVTKYFVDIYASLRLPHFKRHISPSCDSPLSVHERRRLTQAFIRFQIIANMYGVVPSTTPFDRTSFLDRIFSLFDAWECEQLSQVNRFLFVLCQALIDCEHFETQDTFGRLGIVKAVARQRYCTEFYPRLVPFMAKLMTAAEKDPLLMQRLKSWKGLGPGEMDGTFYNHAFFAASHHYRRGRRFETKSLHSNTWRKENGDQLKFCGESPRQPPWGWVEALKGRRITIWGDNLHPAVTSAVEEGEAEKTRMINIWRWMGFVFWDMERADALLIGLKKERSPVYTSGWLVRLWGEGA